MRDCSRLVLQFYFEELTKRSNYHCDFSHYGHVIVNTFAGRDYEAQDGDPRPQDTARQPRWGKACPLPRPAMFRMALKGLETFAVYGLDHSRDRDESYDALFTGDKCGEEEVRWRVLSGDTRVCAAAADSCPTFCFEEFAGRTCFDSAWQGSQLGNWVVWPTQRVANSKVGVEKSLSLLPPTKRIEGPRERFPLSAMWGSRTQGY